MLALRSLGKWFDHLRKEGVYDNTRIIIVADHGWNLYNFDDLLVELDDRIYDLEWINPLLMVKDFNSKEFDIDYTFMTNADTPSLATSGLIDSPVNPFTGNPINMLPKEDDIDICLGTETNLSKNNGNTFINNSKYWFRLSGDALSPANITAFIPDTD